MGKAAIRIRVAWLKRQLEEEIKRHEQEEYEYEKWQLSVEGSIDKDHNRLEKKRFKQHKYLRVVQEQKSTSEQLQKEIQGLKHRMYQGREDDRIAKRRG